MSDIRYYCCQKCNEVESYEVDGDWTSFPRGEYLMHFDYLTTGFKSFEAAEKWLSEHPLKDES